MFKELVTAELKEPELGLLSNDVTWSLDRPERALDEIEFTVSAGILANADVDIDPILSAETVAISVLLIPAFKKSLLL